MESEASRKDHGLALESGTYQVIRARLEAQAKAFREARGALDRKRKETFGAVKYELTGSERVVTAHSCIPADMVMVTNNTFLFGFNVKTGLKKEVAVSDVFSIYHIDPQTGTLREENLEVLSDSQFVDDFRRLYNVYEKTEFRKFALVQDRLYMKFSTGSSTGDIAVFKWVVEGDKIHFADGRAEAEYRKIAYFPKHPFEWKKPARNAYRYGDYPHVSIEDAVFVSCTGGSLTVKIDNNTENGVGIHREDVEFSHQKVDDAEIFYGRAGQLLVFKVRPYKEKTERCFIFNPQLGEVVRVDSVGVSFAELPDEHGVVFSNGYYLSTGVLRMFERGGGEMILEKIVESPSGEDSLFVFYNRSSGEYALLPYRLVSQSIEEVVLCHGFTLFPDGRLVTLKADDNPQKHHLVQLRSTPFYRSDYQPAGKTQSPLHKVGNKEVVRCLADCNEILLLLDKGDLYSEVYADVFKRCEAILDAYGWLLSDPDGRAVHEVLSELKRISGIAIEEFDKVLRDKGNAGRLLEALERKSKEEIRVIRSLEFKRLSDYASKLSSLKKIRAEAEELSSTNYIDFSRLDELKRMVDGEANGLATRCGEFLARDEAFDSYKAQLSSINERLSKAGKLSEIRPLETEMEGVLGELELLISMVNDLPISDDVENSRILDSIAGVYTSLNQIRAEAKKKSGLLAVTETGAKFNAQIKLLNQSAEGFLEISDTVERCNEGWNKISIHLEEMEGSFTGVEEYVSLLTRRREEIQQAFEQRKTFLTEQRAKKISELVSNSERVMGAIQARLSRLHTEEEISSYILADALPKRVRVIAEEISSLGEAVAGEGILSSLKRVHQSSLQQLRDRNDLSSPDGVTIRLGDNVFNVIKHPLSVTVVHKNGSPHVHLTSTQFYSPISDPRLQDTEIAWGLSLPSETLDLYRSEFLACELMEDEQALTLTDDELIELAKVTAGSRVQDGYAKGVHDEDAIRIARAVRDIKRDARLLSFQPSARALALLFWFVFCPEADKTLWSDRLAGVATRNKVFPRADRPDNYVEKISEMIAEFCGSTNLFPQSLAKEAGEYLYEQLLDGGNVTVSLDSLNISAQIEKFITQDSMRSEYEETRGKLAKHPVHDFEFVRNFVGAFVSSREEEDRERSVSIFNDEVAVTLFCKKEVRWTSSRVPLVFPLNDMRGSHPLVKDGTYLFDYLDLSKRVSHHKTHVLPIFQKYQAIKNDAVSKATKDWKLENLKPVVLSTFVRNQLIDKFYLPLIGASLSKQIGVAGENKRTDLMGLMLILSPPGYGKTTLIEYVAERLGMVFVKVNGPALGRETVSLDPEDAPDGAAREEIRKLNLAFEMGDNVMLCIDDIQHCSAEFLQKFISLCDAQRKIEGVWEGRGRTYDLKGKRFAVVMAGNPYTETGQKFRIPDMLANRADVYNLGDFSQESERYFRSSYLENSATSSAFLSNVVTKHPSDFRTFLKLVEDGEEGIPENLEGAYSPKEVEDVLAVLRLLSRIRDIVTLVNQRYIASANQSEEFRQEPPFRLQGSYRDMNKLASKVVPVMTDSEIVEIVKDHYKRESQTLASHAESNYLAFLNLTGWASAEDTKRWGDIVSAYQKNAAIRGLGAEDPVTKVVAQLSTVRDELRGIGQGLTRLGKYSDSTQPASEVTIDPQVLNLFFQRMEEMWRERANLSTDKGREEGSRFDRNDGGGKKAIEFELTEDILSDDDRLFSYLKGIAEDLKKRRAEVRILSGGTAVAGTVTGGGELGGAKVRGGTAMHGGTGGGGPSIAKEGAVRRGRYLNVQKAMKLAVSHVEDKIQYLTGKFALGGVSGERMVLKPIEELGAEVLIENSGGILLDAEEGEVEFTVKRPLRITGIGRGEEGEVHIFAEIVT